MGSRFIGGGFGSAAAMQLWPHAGWTGISLLGAGLSLLALLAQMATRRNH
jgi:hypothetical protein